MSTHTIYSSPQRSCPVPSLDVTLLCNFINMGSGRHGATKKRHLLPSSLPPSLLQLLLPSTRGKCVHERERESRLYQNGKDGGKSALRAHFSRSGYENSKTTRRASANIVVVSSALDVACYPDLKRRTATCMQMESNTFNRTELDKHHEVSGQASPANKNIAPTNKKTMANSENTSSKLNQPTRGYVPHQNTRRDNDSD